MSRAHQACTLSAASTVDINSDGTTYNQKKVQAVIANGVVLGVEAVAEGSAESIIEGLEYTFLKIKEVGQELGIPNVDKIGWTLIWSSMSDGAATQHAFNRLLQDKINETTGTISSSNTGEAHSLLAAFCGMHLGVNLRAAAVKGMSEQLVTPGDERHTAVDTCVHEFCKLLGHLSNCPEYGRGVCGYPEYLKELEQAQQVGDSSSDVAERVEASLKVRLERQVGSRYFVTARNAGRILFLAPTAKQYLEDVQKMKELNGLEANVLKHLENDNLLAALRAEALFFDKVYADLMCLLKSNKLGKSLLDMNQHYLELLQFLETIAEKPRLLLDTEFNPFTTEPLLYGVNKAINHRLHTNYKDVRRHLYEEEGTDRVLTFIQTGAAAMATKMKTYQADQLPGGRLWQPTGKVREVCSTLKPTNDACESALGLNDWLQSNTSNFSQRTTSAMVEVMKNATLTWFEKQSEAFQASVVNLAVKQANKVLRDDRERQTTHRLKRKRKREAEVQKATLKRARKFERLQKLSQIPKLNTVHELDEALALVEGRTEKQRQTNRLKMVKEQLNIRQELNKCSRRVTFSVKGRKKTSDELRNELIDIMEAETDRQKPPEVELSVGRRFWHLCEENSQQKWYTGSIDKLDERVVTVKYDDFDDKYEWNRTELYEDFSNNDLVFL